MPGIEVSWRKGGSAFIPGAFPPPEVKSVSQGRRGLKDRTETYIGVTPCRGTLLAMGGAHTTVPRETPSMPGWKEGYKTGREGFSPVGVLQMPLFDLYDPRSLDDPEFISTPPAPDNAVPPGSLGPLAVRGTLPVSGAISSPSSPTSLSRNFLSLFIFTDQSRFSRA